MPDPSCAKLSQWWVSNILKVTVFSQLLSLLYGISNLLLPRVNVLFHFFKITLFFSLSLLYFFFFKQELKHFSLLSFHLPKPNMPSMKHVLMTEHRLTVLIFHSRELGSFSSSALLLSKEWMWKVFLGVIGIRPRVLGICLKQDIYPQM